MPRTCTPLARIGRTHSKPIIYFAGKIGPEDWRCELFGHRTGGVDASGDDFGFKTVFDKTYVRDMGAVVYGGPFFISCDHRCAHGPATHGARPKGCLVDVDEGVLETHKAIWRVNRARIERADLVFAYINEVDCFGTLIELGYAAALNKPITIGIGRNIKIEEFNDLWMARQCATMGDALLGSPNATFEQFLLRVSGAAQ
jgi:hypothetical protein